jgi:hypothetical protein
MLHSVISGALVVVATDAPSNSSRFSNLSYVCLLVCLNKFVCLLFCCQFAFAFIRELRLTLGSV